MPLDVRKLLFVAGIGIRINRPVMLLTNENSIRNVILFSQMRPIVKEEEEEK